MEFSINKPHSPMDFLHEGSDERLRLAGSDVHKAGAASLAGNGESPQASSLPGGDTVNISEEGRAMQHGGIAASGLGKPDDEDDQNAAEKLKKEIQKQIKEKIQDAQARLAQVQARGSDSPENPDDPSAALSAAAGAMAGNAEAEAIQAEINMLTQQLMVLSQQLMQTGQGGGGVGGMTAGIGGQATGASGQGQRISVTA